MQSFQLPARYKGGRNYIHGTDLFDATQAVIATRSQHFASKFEIAFNAMATQGVTLFFEAPNEFKPCGTGTYWDINEKHKFWLVEDGRVVSQHVDYPESLVTDRATFEAESAQVSIAPNVVFSNIEVWVPMIKILHLRLFPDAIGKWVFVRAKLTNYSPNRGAGHFEVALASRVGQKITRNEVFLDGQKAGDIFFMQM